MTVSSLEKRDAPNQRAQSSEWLEQNTNVNLTQQRTSAEYYRRMTNGGTDRGVSVVGNVSNEGALAQSLNMVGNPPPNPLTTQHLRQAVDGVQHPAGPSHTNIGDMNTHGRDSAADRRKTNNGLLSTCVPHSMTDAQQLVAAMAAIANANSTNTNSPTGLTEDEALQFAMLESKSSMMTEAELNTKMPSLSKERTPRIAMPHDWPFTITVPTTKKPNKRGAERLMERLQSKNGEGYHSKLSKKKMTNTQKSERRMA